jgi:hypothetical protein
MKLLLPLAAIVLVLVLVGCVDSPLKHRDENTPQPIAVKWVEVTPPPHSTFRRCWAHEEGIGQSYSMSIVCDPPSTSD